MRLTGTLIEYSERRTIAQYEHKDCKVSMQVAFDDGEDIPAVLDKIQEDVRARVHSMLRIAGAKVPTPVAAAAAPPADPPAKKRGPKPKPPAAAATDDPTADDVNDDPTADDAPADDPTADDVTDDDLGLDEPAAKPITDEQLVKAVQTKNQEIVNPTAIKSLVKEFGTSVASIPNDKRDAFLKKLATLKKAA